jgi:hypothetical protein
MTKTPKPAPVADFARRRLLGALLVEALSPAEDRELEAVE